MMLQFAEALQKMTWSEMNRIAKHFAESINQCIEDGEDVDQLFIAYLLIETAEDITKEHEKSVADEAAE